jgi:F-type H+-transporting ATPase subunit b
MRSGFGLSTDLFETNILNLAVVIRIVVNVVGDAVSNLLDQRKKNVLASLQEADNVARDASERLEEARLSMETVRGQAQEILSQARTSIEQENRVAQKRLKENVQRLQERGRQTVQLERQRAIQVIIQQVSDLAMVSAENKLLSSLGSREINCSKQKKLNELHVFETFNQLK